MHDRAERAELSYTHEFLAHMLGADRKSVAVSAQAMQAAGLIGYPAGGRSKSSIVKASKRQCVNATGSYKRGSTLF
jgi:hypothetical protein